MKGKILVTGCAGFIGSNLTDKLLGDGWQVTGIDNFNDYYDPAVKESNIAKALEDKNFKLHKIDILDIKEIAKVFSNEKPEIVIHLAARAGVRPSLLDPLLYAQNNVLGTVNLLKLSVDNNVSKFILGSSSSVYGDSKNVPFSENDLCQDIISPYGASKRAAEFFVESFSKCFGLKTIILRFFTVYGERGRPDMAPAIFTKAVLSGKTLNVFGDLESARDYTYIGDIVDGITRSIERDFGSEFFNLGRSVPIKLKDFIKVIERATGKEAKLKKLERQRGDVVKTWANTTKAQELLEWTPKISVEEGINRYITWQKNRN